MEIFAICIERNIIFSAFCLTKANKNLSYKKIGN